MSYPFSFMDHFLTKLANSDRRSQKAHIDHFKKLGREFDALILDFDTNPTDEAYFAIIAKYRYIYTVILSAECGAYTTWYCYNAIRPYSKALRSKMKRAISERFGEELFDGELNLYFILATEQCHTSKKRAELKRMANVKIPEGVTTINTDSFCALGIKKLYLPDSLVEIGNHAFSCNPIGSVSIGRNVKIIGEYAFGSGKNPLRIDFRGYKQEWNSIYVSDIASPWVKVIVTCLDGKIVMEPKK